MTSGWKEEEREKSNLPKFLRWLGPVEPDHTNNHVLMQCSCGRFLWSGCSQKIREHHLGHTMRMAEHGSIVSFFKVKTGLVNYRTLSELFKDVIMKRDKK
jgi:hypothetical protein